MDGIFIYCAVVLSGASSASPPSSRARERGAAGAGAHLAGRRLQGGFGGMRTAAWLPIQGHRRAESDGYIYG